MQFSEFSFNNSLLQALQQLQYDQATDVQQQCIPLIQQGKDLLVSAQTGTGKTAAFSLPIIDRLSRQAADRAPCIQALVLVPTRELALQVAKNIAGYCHGSLLQSTAVVGGMPIDEQKTILAKGVDILVATPGRLIDLIKQQSIALNSINYVVLDEADRMLELGFSHDLKFLLQRLPKKRQNLLFSATYNDSISQLTKSWLLNAQSIMLDCVNMVASNIQQRIIPADKKMKATMLAELVKTYRWSQLLVFVRTKAGADELALFLNNALQAEGVISAAIHSEKSQYKRSDILKKFKQQKIHVLVATDVAARGLDIKSLPAVINMDLPFIAEDYIHRIGRTARAGEHGMAFSLVSADEYSQLTVIESMLKKTIRREYMDTHYPEHDLPVSNLGLKKTVSQKKRKKGVKIKLKEGKRKPSASGQHLGPNPNKTGLSLGKRKPRLR